MRKLHIGNEVWQYRVGTGSIVIQTPLGSKICVSCATVKDLTPDDFERGKWKNTSDGMITPRELKAYIERNMV